MMYDSIPNYELWQIHLVEELPDIQSHISGIDVGARTKSPTYWRTFAPPQVNS